jgi:hypothetical protein
MSRLPGLLAAIVVVGALLLGWKKAPAPEPMTLPDIAAAVRADPAWMQGDQACPADVMGPRDAPPLPESRFCDLDDDGSCLARCKGGEGGSCYWLANRLEAAEADKQAVTALFNESCRLGVASGCTNRASYLFNHPRREADAACALRSFERSCGRDDAWGCTMVAVQLTRDRAPSEDERRRVLDALGKSCLDGEDSPACIAGRNVGKSLKP